MRNQLDRWWFGIRKSLWLIPGLMTLGAALLAVGTVELDSQLARNPAPVAGYVAFGGGVEGARGVLAAIATTTITVTGVVFSLTIVALQLAASQFSPRVLVSFSRDRVTQVTMGAFIGTFTYALLVLRTVSSDESEGAAFVPNFAVGVALALMLVSIGLLIYYFHHVAHSIRAATTIDRVTDDAMSTILHLFPEAAGSRDPHGDPRAAAPAEPPGVVRAERAGYFQAIDAEALFRYADDHDLVLRMELLVGEFVLPGTTLAAVWPAEAAEREAVQRTVRQAYLVGPERTMQHDAGFGIRQLADIGIKALSPAINDPTTAVTCIDRLGELLVTLGQRRPPDPVRRCRDGRARFIARELSFDEAVEIAFAQLRDYGSRDARVLARLISTLGRVGACVPPPLRPALAAQLAAAVAAGEQTQRPRVDVEFLARITTAAVADLTAPPPACDAVRYGGLKPGDRHAA